MSLNFPLDMLPAAIKVSDVQGARVTKCGAGIACLQRVAIVRGDQVRGCGDGTECSVTICEPTCLMASAAPVQLANMERIRSLGNLEHASMIVCHLKGHLTSMVTSLSISCTNTTQLLGHPILTCFHSPRSSREVFHCASVLSLQRHSGQMSLTIGTRTAVCAWRGAWCCSYCVPTTLTQFGSRQEE